MSPRPTHPALTTAYEAIRALRTVQAGSPQEAAELILRIAGDGTGEPNLIGELTTILVAIARQATVQAQLPDAAGRYVREAAAYAQMTIDQRAGDYLAQALNLLEQPDRPPARGFYDDFGLPVEDDAQPTTPPAPVPAPTAHLEYAGSHR